MKFGKALLAPIKIAFLTSILSMAFVFLDASSIYKNALPIVFLVSTIVSLIVFIYSKIPELYSAPEISIPFMFLVGILWLFESASSSQNNLLEAGILSASCLAGFYFFVWRKGFPRIYLTVILIGILITGVYLLQIYDSVLLIIGLTLCAMPLVLYSIKYSQEYFRRPKTPVRNLDISLGIIAFAIFIGYFYRLGINTYFMSAEYPSQGAFLVLRSLLVSMIFLGSLSRFRQLEDKPSKVFRFYWWGMTTAISILIFVFHPLLSRLSLLYGLNEQFGRLSEPLWIVFASVAGVQIILWVHRKMSWQWNAFTVGSAGGLLISYLWTPLTYAISFNLFVPGQSISVDFDDGLLLGSSIGILVLFVTIFLVVYLSRPQNRLRSVSAACIAGLTVSIFVFATSGAILSLIASQRSIYGVAFTRVGYDEVGWVSALVEAVLYINPWVYGVLAACLLIGLLPAVLIGLTWPIKRNLVTEDQSHNLSSSVPLQLLLLSVTMIISMALFRLLEEKLVDSIVRVGLKTWWKPEWYTSVTILFPSLIFVGIVVWIFIRMSTWDRSPRNAIFVCLSGLIVMLHGLGIWLIDSNILIMFVLLGIGTEIFRYGLRLWKTPETELSANLMPKLVEFDTFSGIVLAFLMFLIALLPLMVIVIGLGMIVVVAIPELQLVMGPPPGIEWLLKMLEDAVRTTQVLTAATLLIGFGFAFSIYLMIDLLGNPVRIGYWWGKLVPIWERLKGHVRKFFSNKIRAVLFGFSLLLLLIWLVVSTSNSHNILIILLFLVSYIYFKLRPGWFRKISWSVYIIAGLILLICVFASTVSMIESLSVLAGPALALIYRGLVVYEGDSRRMIFRSLFFPALGIFFFLYASYFQPITIVQDGIAHFKDGRWENIGVENGPISGDKKYSFLKDTNGNLWIAGYYGPEALLQNGELKKVRVSTLPDFSTDKVSTFGMMLERDENYFFINDHSLLGIVQTDGTFRSINPKRLRPIPVENTNDQDNSYGENAEKCSTYIAIDENEKYECPTFSGEITSAVIDKEENIWLGTSNNGVGHFHHDLSSDLWSWEFLTTQNSELLSDQITGVADEGNGTILALSTIGMSVRSPDGGWTNYSFNDLGPDPQTIFTDSQGRVWVGSSNGISTWDDSSWQKSYLTNPASISGFYEDGKKDIWALSASGAWRYSGQEWLKVIDIPRDPFWQNPFGFSSFYSIQPAGSGVYKMVEDGVGNIWFGGPKGLASYDQITEQIEYFYPSNSGLPSENVQDLQLDADGSLWVSTYTPNIAYRTELPIVGFSVLMIGTFLGVIYMGYRRAPWFKALQISQRLANQPQNLLQEVQQAFADINAGEVLEALAEQPFPDGGYSRLVGAFASVTGQNQISSQDKAAWLLDELQNTKDILWQSQTVLLYQYIAQGIQARSISDIANIHLAVLRSQGADHITLTYNDSLPFELPVFADRNIIDALEMLGKTSIYLRKYMQVENPQDRLGFIADSLGAVERSNKDAASIVGAESYFVQEICNLWLNIIRRELDVLSGHADLRVEFRTRQVRRSEEAVLVLSVRNTGSSIANQVEVSLLPNDQIHVSEKTTRSFEYIGAGSSVVVEFAIGSPPTGDVRISGEITWSDRIEDNNRADFADVIRFYEPSGQFERIPNPYVVGHPVKSASLFQGRDDIFDFISHNIQSTTQSHTLVLYGQRRTGKTSILYQLLGGKLGSNFIPVLVDVQEIAPGIQGMSDLFFELALRTESALEKAGINPEKINEDSFSASPTRAFGRYLTGIEKLLDGQKIIYMFDEFELLEEKILQGKLEVESLGYLRSLIQHRENLIFIFTGTHKLEQMSKDYWSIFFNIALHQRVSFMEKDATIQLIRKPVREKLNIDDLAVEKIVSLTQGHPYFTQLICWALVNHCNQKERNYATLNDLNEVLKDIVFTGESYFAYVWTQISAEEKIIMAALAERLTPGRNAISVQEIIEALKNAGMQDMDKIAALKLLDGLTDLEILASSGQDGTLYSYRVGLIGEWVKSSKPLRYLVEREL